MFNSREEFNYKSVERMRPSPYGNDGSDSKCRSNFKILNPKSKNNGEDEKLQGNEFSAKNNLMNYFQNLPNNHSIFNINEMSPTINNYYIPPLPLSNLDENKEKPCETPIKSNNPNNDIWYHSHLGKEYILNDSPLFPRHLNFKSNKNFEISTSVKKINYCYNPSNITKKNLAFGIESSNQHNNIINGMNNNFILENINNHLYNYNNTNNNHEFYQSKKSFNHPQNQYGGLSRIQLEKESVEKKIMMSSDEEEVSVATKNTSHYKNLKNDNKSVYLNYSPKGTLLNDNCILNSYNSILKDKTPKKREICRKNVKRISTSKVKQLKKSEKKIKSIILNLKNDGNMKRNMIKDKKAKIIEDSKPLITEIVQKTKCTCSKTQCIKKYCECFSNGKFCIDCECENCQNTPDNVENLNELRAKENTTFGKDKEDVLHKTNNIVCNCTKSGCRKKYCECFKAGKKCSEECRCIHCDNMDECRSPSHIRKNKNSFLSEKRNNSKFRQRNQLILDRFSDNLSDDNSNSVIVRSFDTNCFKLYNINVLIAGEVITISEKNEDLNITINKTNNALNPNWKISNSNRNNQNKKTNKKRQLNKIKKRFSNSYENLENSKNKVDPWLKNGLEVSSRNRKFSNESAKIEKDIKQEAELNCGQNNEPFKNINAELADSNKNHSSRRSARLRLNRNEIEIFKNKFEKLSDLKELNCENNLDTNNLVKYKNDFNLIDQYTRSHRCLKQKINVDQNQILNFYSSVLNKECINHMLTDKNFALKNVSVGTNPFKNLENNMEGENDICLSFENKGSDDKFVMFESASKLMDTNRKEQIQKITETPKLCEKKRYRNTTSSKTRILNEDVYILTNSTMNQTPILNNDKNNKKKLIEVDEKIVKNLQAKYY